MMGGGRGVDNQESRHDIWRERYQHLMGNRIEDDTLCNIIYVYGFNNYPKPITYAKIIVIIRLGQKKNRQRE